MTTIENIYNCGCVAYDVPVLTRCEVHNGYVVATVPETKVLRPKTYKLDGFRLIHSDLKKVVHKLQDGFVDLVLSYPQHDPFYVRSHLTPAGTFRFGDKDIFKDYYRVLSDDGSMFLIVEYSVLAEALLACTFAGFKIQQIVNTSSSIIREHLSFHSKKKKDEQSSWLTCRAGVLLSKKGAIVPRLPDEIELKRNADELLHMFQLDASSRILDGSCIHYPFMFSALRNGHKIIGVTENSERYHNIVNYLERD